MAGEVVLRRRSGSTEREVADTVRSEGVIRVAADRAGTDHDNVGRGELFERPVSAQRHEEIDVFVDELNVGELRSAVVLREDPGAPVVFVLAEVGVGDTQREAAMREPDPGAVQAGA